MTSHRARRVGDLVRESLARLLREQVRDPRIGFVTVTEVRMSPDLRHARAYVSMLGDESERRRCLDALRHAAPFLRRSLAHEVQMRRAPELHFLEDAALAQGMRMDSLLREIQGEADTEDDEREDEV